MQQYRSTRRVYRDGTLRYAVGDAIPLEEAMRQGLVEAPPPPPADPPPPAKPAPARKAPAKRAPAKRRTTTARTRRSSK